MNIQYVDEEKGVDTFFIFMAQLLNSLGFPETEDMYFCPLSWQSQRSDVDNGFLKLKAFFSLTLRKILVSLIYSKEKCEGGRKSQIWSNFKLFSQLEYVLCVCAGQFQNQIVRHIQDHKSKACLCVVFMICDSKIWDLDEICRRVKMGLLEDAIKMDSCLFSVQSPSKGSIWRAAALSALLRISLPRGNPENRNLEIHIKCCSEIQACSTVQKEHSNTLCAADSDFAPDTREVSSIQI